MNQLTLEQDLGLRFATNKSKSKTRFGLYRCSCGNTKKCQMNSVKNNLTKSCGCLLGKHKVTHNMSRHRLNRIFNNMIQRTTNVKNTHYNNYVALGITVCEEWKNNRSLFFEWAFQNGYADGLTIDRINVNGNYEPSNCRWTTMDIQIQNSRLLRSTNSTGYKGIEFNKLNNKWRARICVNYKRIQIGYFETQIEAAQAYDDYVILHNLEHTINNVKKELIT